MRRAWFAVLVALADFVAIVACFALVGVVYHATYLHVGGMALDFIVDGCLFGCLFLLVNGLRAQYSIHKYVFIGSAQEVFFSWNVTSVLMLLSVFFLKETAEFSRVSAFLSYAIGFVSLLALHGLIRAGARYLSQAGRLCLLRVVLVGNSEELQDFNATHRPWSMGIDIAASAVLRGCETLADDLALAVALSRIVRPDSVFILSSWADNDSILSAVQAFTKVPAAIHLGPQPLLTRFETADIHRIGGMRSLKMVRHPQSFFQHASKRALDLAIACVIFMVTAPVSALIAIAIKFESRGPVLAHERFVGFNQQSFDVLKFRVMHSDDAAFRTSRSHDGLTRIGRFLVKTRFEGLPQILNVIKGDMSLVGPRPKPLDLERRYGKLIASYGRRNNVKPGLTGWAQIHALRSDAMSDQALQAHVEHDLHYVDRQTLTLDLRILAHRCLLPAAPDRRRALVDLVASRARETSRKHLFANAFGPDAQARRQADLLGIDVDDLTLEDALRIGRACLADPESRTLFFVNAHTLNLVSASPVYRRVIEQGHLVFGDGSGAKIAAAMRGTHLHANLNGTDFIPALLASTNEEKKSCYLLGAEQEVVAKAADEIRRRFPGWTVVGCHHGFLDRDTTAVVIDEIRAARPDLLLVGMGNPLQEYWISENQEKLPVHLIVGVGALFAYISGDYVRAPLVMRKLGIEWLWVLVMQPHKWRRYVFGNPLFLRRALMHATRKGLQRRLGEASARRKRASVPSSPRDGLVQPGSEARHPS